jgi:DNA-binding response OmpR family regulator
MTRLLLVDDDPTLLFNLSNSLIQDGYQVATAECAEEAYRQANAFQPDLIVLDIMMPGTDGITACRHLRTFSQVPILFLTHGARAEFAVPSLTSGGDDFVTKPFSLAELKARIESILRRAQAIAASDDPVPAPPETVYDDGVLRVDLRNALVSKRGHAILLSNLEMRLLACLVRNAGEVLPHAHLLREVWGAGYEEQRNYLSLYIRYLRSKIEDDPHEEAYIQTRFRVGYGFCPGPHPRKK